MKCGNKIQDQKTKSANQKVNKDKEKSKNKVSQNSTNKSGNLSELTVVSKLLKCKKFCSCTNTHDIC